MEVATAGPHTPGGGVGVSPRRGTPLPLSRLVEESRSPASIPTHLLESKIYAKLKSNSVMEAEPAELHFSGFQLHKDYLKTLKLINISSEVMNIHIIPTQTRHFQTTYTKKYRLIPGLAYTLKVAFCPDEWRYFYDCVRVHCQGEENLLIPVHAYPVIDDLHIPPRIDLSAVPLGQSTRHTIPLRCSCPVEFEFQVYVLQPHEAFAVHPLTGVIPASGEARITVTFCPVQYETCQVTIQLVVSQFNTRPQLCTITGRCSPHLSHLERKSQRSKAAPAESVRPPPAAQVAPRSQIKHKSTGEASKSKTPKESGDAKLSPKLPLDVCTPAGVAKMLIKASNKLNSKDLKEAISSGCMVGLPSRQMKEALFNRRVQQNVKEEEANHLRWQVHLGLEPLSERDRRHTLEEREVALHEYTIKRGDLIQDEDFPAGESKIFSCRVIREAGQAPEGSPSFQFYSCFHWELRQRSLRLFQQAARKVVIRCRVKHRLVSLKKLADSVRNQPSVQKEEKTIDPEVSPVKVFPSTFPIFTDEDDPLACVHLAALPVDPVDVTMATRVPFFKLQVPQHYQLMGHQPVSTWEAFTSYIPTTLARPLRSTALERSVPNEVAAKAHRRASPEAEEEEVHDNEEEQKKAFLSFTAPEGLLMPFPANPLRIFNPAPGLQTFKPAPKYLESDLEFHLCPLPRYAVPGSGVCGMKTRTPRTHTKFQDYKEVIPELMTWRNFASNTLNYLFNHPTLTSRPPPTRTEDASLCTLSEEISLRTAVDYGTDTLPLAPPPPIASLADDLTLLGDTGSEDSGVQLSPEMIRAEFLSGEALVSNGNLATGITARHQWERQMEETHRSEFNQMGRRVMARLKQLEAAAGDSRSPKEAVE